VDSFHDQPCVGHRVGSEPTQSAISCGLSKSVSSLPERWIKNPVDPCPRRLVRFAVSSTHPALRLTTLSPFGFCFVGLDADGCREDSGEDAEKDLDHGCSFNL
jgi:hypothetical protein